jgi:predicted lipid-binding transport protein (Tim44 family)
MDTGSFPIDIVLFAMIAVFLVLRLRSILGRRTGFERQAPATPVQSPMRGPVLEAQAEPAGPPRPRRTVPDARSEPGQALAAMARIDPSFTPDRFLDGAEQAFRIIVGAYATGDRAALHPLLSPDIMAAFEQAIAAREANGETQRTEIRGIAEQRIEAVALRSTTADITVRFVTDQVSLTVGKDGQPVHGTESVTEITDIWTFERDLRAPDPTWRLTGARSA